MVIANWTINRPIALNNSHMHYLIMKEFKYISIFQLSDYSLLTYTKSDKENVRNTRTRINLHEKKKLK